MSPPPLSIVIVSRGRPAHLARGLSALALQSHPMIEVIVVADPAGLDVRRDLPLKRVAFDRPNISAARNAGIGAAASDIVAFIDDDAVAEPDWAAHMAAVFADPDVIAASGVTRGPDGIAWQVRAERITPDGPRPFKIAGPDPVLVLPQDGTTLGTIGTNCAFRRAALLEVGGFDPAFAYHLDESDLNLRMAQRFPHMPSAVVPLAEIAHATAPGTVRDAARLPGDLSPIGRSATLFARRHGGDPEAETRRQRIRLLRLMVSGRLDPMRVNLLMRTLAQGAAAAAGLPLPLPEPLQATQPPAFLRLPTQPDRPRLALRGWQWQAQRLQAHAARASAAGALVSLSLMSPTILPQRRRFSDAGWWERTGGRWASNRAYPANDGGESVRSSASD